MKRAVVVVAAFVFLPAIAAAQKQQLSVEWIYSDAGEELTKLPRFQWRADSSLLLEGRSGFDVINPTTARRTIAADLDKLRRPKANSDASDDLEWPSEFDHAGLLARLGSSILDLDSARVISLPDDAASLKAQRFSPDGNRLGFVRDNDLYILDIEAATETRLTDTGSETTLNGTLSWVYWEELFGRRDIGYWWSPDSKSIAFLSTNESDVEESYFLDYRLDAPELPTRLVRQHYPRAGGANPSVKVGVADPNGDRIRWLHLPGHEYVARVQWLPDGRRLAIQTLNRAQDRLDLFFVEVTTGRAKRILTETDPAWVNLHDDLYFLKDGRHFLWRSERDGYAHLYRYRLDGTLVNQVTRGEWALRSSGGVFWLRQSVMTIDEDNDWVYFTALKDSSIERQLYRVHLDGSRQERISREAGTHQISFSPDSRYYLDTFSSATRPPSLTLHHSNGEPIMTLAEPKTELANQLGIIPPQFFTIPTRTGFPMPAEILKPVSFDPKKRYPIIFHIYAGPSAPTVFNSWQTSRYFDQLLLRKGYLVVRFDHPSAAGISKKLENRLARLMSGPTEMADIVDGVRWLKAQPWVDEDRFGIWGWSGGGSFTLNAMTNTKEFKAGISVAPVTDWRFYDTKWAEFAMKTPAQNPEGYRRTSFVESAANLHGRLLLVHGTSDDNVHPRNSWVFIEELIQANIAFDMMFYPMRKHPISDRPARIHLYTKMLEFWEKNL